MSKVQAIQTATSQRVRLWFPSFLREKWIKNYDNTYQFVHLNRKFLEICGTEDVLVCLKRIQENYFGHIARQKNTSIVKRLFFNDNQSKKRVRPIKTRRSLLEGKSADNFYREALKKRKKGYGWLRP